MDLHGCHVFNVHFSDAFLFVYKIFSSAASTFIHICELWDAANFCDCYSGWSQILETYPGYVEYKPLVTGVIKKKTLKKKLYKIGFSHAYSTVYALTVGSYPVPIQVAACLEWKSHRIRHKNTKGCIVVDVLLQVLVWKSSFSNRPMSLKAYLKPKHCTAVYNSLRQILDNFVLLLVWNQL